jgi:hypothetical protein
MKKIWDNFKLTAKVAKTNNMQFRVALAAKDGAKGIQVSEWYMKKSSGEYKPSGKNLFIPINATINEQPFEVAGTLAHEILQAIEDAKDFPVEDPAGAVYAKEEL